MGRVSDLFAHIEKGRGVKIVITARVSRKNVYRGFWLNVAIEMMGWNDNAVI